MDIIDDLIEREGPETNDPKDAGGRTKYGISERGNRDLWVNGPPTHEQARQRYEDRYVNGPGFNHITDTQLRNQLIDFGVNSGPAVAIKALQGVLKVTQDGVIGPTTLKALTESHPEDICNCVVAARIKMICRIVQKNPTQLKFLVGWADRALQFLYQ